MDNKGYFMQEYENIIATKVQHYIDRFKNNYDEDDCDIYFMSSGNASIYLDASCDLFSRFQRPDFKGVISHARKLAQSCSTHDMPYIILHNILERFRNAILCEILKEEHNPSVAYTFLKQSHIAADAISKFYLSEKVKAFLENNRRRIKTIEQLVDTSSIHFFEGHLVWLDSLAQAIVDQNARALPELSPEACVLGQWLDNDGREVIADPERWQHLDKLHHHLHLIGKRVEVLLRTTPIDYHYLLLLLEKADHVSLSIGIDLTLISNIEYIKSSTKDPLTGVLNRQLMEKIFKTQFELSKTLDTGFALIMADIDDFKQVNDRYGHVFGDVVLRTFADVLKGATRKSDFIIRFGGEEFILILPVTTLDESTTIAEKMCLTFAQKHFEKEGEGVNISASFGVSYIHPGEDEPSSQRHMAELIDEVDQKLLVAKKSGKNRVVS